MKKTVTLGLIFCSICLGLPSQAQLLKKIQNAAQNAAQNVATQKVEQKRDQETDKALSGLMGSMFEPTSTESSYQFSGYISMEIISKDKKGKPELPVQFTYLMGGDTQVMGVNFQDPESKMNMTTIMDSKNQAMVMLMEEKGEKSSMALKMNMEKMQDIAEKEMGQDPEEYKLVKTGNTKTILGYTCEEYLVTSKDGNGQYWITEKPIEGMSMFSPQSGPMGGNKGRNPYEAIFANAPEGTFLEMLFTQKDGSSFEMKVTEIEPKKESSFKMSEYPNMMSGN
jgi:hypothetical protein